MSLRSITALCLVVLSGCPTAGQGTGWVAGPLWVQHCQGGDPLDEDGDFDLRADFFFGDPLFDTTQADAERRSSLMVRIQETSSNIEEANGLVIQFHDTLQAAQAFVSGEPLAVTDESLCPGCTDLNTAVRMQLNLFVKCPANKAPISAGAYTLEQRQTTGTSRDTECLLLAEEQPAPCPVLDEGQRAEAQQICDSADFSDRETRQAITEVLGDSGSCLYLCEFGRAQRGQDSAELNRFEIDYGDRIAGFFSTRVLDTRAVRLNRCAGANGHLAGMFSFDLVRSRVAQPFP